MQDILLSVKQYLALISRLDEINDDVTAIKLQSHPEDHYIDNHDLLMILQVSIRTLRRWRNTGKLPYKKLGHRFYYRADLIMDVFKVRPDETDDDLSVSASPPTPPEENEIQITCERCPLFVILNLED
jgi:hypothetical protein